MPDIPINSIVPGVPRMIQQIHKGPRLWVRQVRFAIETAQRQVTFRNMPPGDVGVGRLQ